MEEVKVLLENGQESLVNGLFYIFNSKYYFAYTEKVVDENGYVIMHLVQVGKEAVNTPEGATSTGNMVGVEISDEEEWKQVQTSISKIIEDKKSGTQSPDIQYLTNDILVNLRIVSKKTFRLAKDIVTDVLRIDMNQVSVPVEPVSPEVQGVVPVEPVSPEVQGVVPVEPVSPEIQGVVPVEPVSPEAQGVVPVEPVSPEIQGVVPVEPVSPEIQGVVPVEPVSPEVQGVVPVEPVSPEVQGVAPVEPVSPEVQGIVPVEPVGSETPSLVSEEPSNEETSIEDFSNMSNEEFLQDNNVIIDYRSKFFEEQEKNKELQRQIDELNEKINSIKNIIE